MRTLVMLAFVSACASASPSAPDAPPRPPTLRAQLATPVRLAVDPLAATGAITASEREGASWQPAHISLGIAAGALELASDDRGLVLHALEVDVAPISLPMLGGDAQLTSVAVRLPEPIEIGVTWQDEDDAIAVATLDLDLLWSLSANGGTLPLGTQHLPAVPIAIVMQADAGAIHAQVGVDQPGELWSWAGLLSLADLSLELPAHTAPAPVE